MVTVSTVVAIAPELTGIDPARVSTFISYASLQVGPGFGARSDFATALLAAHLLTICSRAGAGGAVSSVKVGDETTTFQLPEGWDSFDTTAYGQQYKSLKRGAVRTPPRV